jgi:4-hydroxybenzoate polyprenyltransferase
MIMTYIAPPPKVDLTTHAGTEIGPLCVDLDGSLIATDTLWESLMLLVKSHPAALLQFPLWLSKGKAALKQEIASRVIPDAALLPYRPEVLSFVREHREAGRRVVLATAADQRIAQSVASHLGLFDEVLASDGKTNLSGQTKLNAIVKLSGSGEFDYIGDSHADMPLWKAAKRAYVVGSQMKRRAGAVCEPLEITPDPTAKTPSLGKAIYKAIRPRQWTKNVLLAVPLVAAHRLSDLHAVLMLAIAIVSFSAAASFVYIMNDLLDIEADRIHPTKRRRPFASGALPVRTGVMLLPVLLVIAFGLAAVVGLKMSAMLVGYVLLSSAYSLYLKRKVIVDVFCLVALYIHRILTGGIAVGVRPSPWLLAFSMFLFISLAFAKRYTELRIHRSRSVGGSKGRGYLVGDLEMIRSMGPSSGYLAVLVLCLYINSDAVLKLYHQPQLLWFVCPVLLFSITRLWFLAERSEMLDDPVHFATHDRVSLLAGVIIALTVAAASVL